MSASNWLGLDSSLAAFGWCAVEARDGMVTRILNADVITTKPDARAKRKTDDTRRRVGEIADEVERIFAEYRPTLVAIESLAMPQMSTKATISRLGRVFGVIEGIVRARGLRLIEVNAKTLKKAVTGNHTAEKAEVLAAMVARWPSLEIHLEPVDKDLRDNLTDAAALCRYIEVNGLAVLEAA